MQNRPSYREIIMATNGARVDVTEELWQIVSIGRWSQHSGIISIDDVRFLQRIGRNLTTIAGPDAAGHVIDGLLMDGNISPPFANYLRSEWRAIADFSEGT